MFEKVFNEYVSNYDFTNSKIKLKFNHSYRVKNLCLKYAIKLGLNEADIRLAEFIGLYHDIGRFNQIKEYDTYDPKISINHGLEGINVLFEEGLINNFNFSKRELEIIKFAILNHNRFKMSDDLDDRKILHAELIRDCDKLDILYLFAYLNEEKLYLVNKEVDPFIKESIKNHLNFEEYDVSNYNFLEYISFPFDTNFDVVLPEMQIYINDLYKRYKIGNLFEEEINEINKYIEKRKK